MILPRSARQNQAHKATCNNRLLILLPTLYGPRLLCAVVLAAWNYLRELEAKGLAGRAGGILPRLQQRAWEHRPMTRVLIFAAEVQAPGQRIDEGHIDALPASLWEGLKEPTFLETAAANEHKGSVCEEAGAREMEQERAGEEGGEEGRDLEGRGTEDSE
ncbi:hypothetical protein NDU88_006398 [Pleurodeles waltl]|uniref:Uncharacterized protein n=1 Tax=Pleurodeles waltl TaxID=8319 RepID=A0AAV7N157_PLEWA|nr:hypothetical protein NDU88_006398 [Pleurodeles waltl]